MRGSRGTWLLVVLAVLTVGVAGIAVKRTPAPPPFVAPAGALRAAPSSSYALLFGDSYFNGANGVTSAQTFGSIAGRQLGYTLFVRGHGGTGFTSADATSGTPNYEKQFGQAIAQIDPTTLRLVVIQGGLNDGASSGEESAAQRVLATAKRTFSAAKVVLVGPVAPTGTVTADHQQVDAALASAASAESVPYVDTSGWVTPQTAGQIIGPDGEHPTVEGHQILAAKLVDALRQAGVPQAQTA